jgi:hypothetical protein
MEELETTRQLVREGKLDSKLRVRLGVFAFLSLLFGGAVLFDIVSYGLSWSLTLGVASVSFLTGLLLLSRMNPVSWDPEREVVVLGRMDIVGLLLLVGYIAVRYAAKTILDEYFHNIITISGVTYSIVFGVMLGRLFGILNTIHQVHSQRDEIVEK